MASGAAADGNTGFGVKIDYVFVEERDDAVPRRGVHSQRCPGWLGSLSGDG